uniref:Integral membrane bound transporter domain-containing protein n=1 Tax=Minutocellus polymorphus TaxID=265543 RepID=A0A7S0FKW7_9STRA
MARDVLQTDPGANEIEVMVANANSIASSPPAPNLERPTPSPRTISAKRMSLPVTATPSRPSRRRLMSGDRPSSKMLRKRTTNNLQTTTHTAACSPSSSYDSQLNKLDVQTASAIIEAPPAPTLRSIRRTSCGISKIRPKAVHFAARMSAALTLSSLFWLIPGYPQGTWVYITALMVSWFPAMDAASVIKKTIQRIQGTIMGAILGILLGYFSYVIDTNQGQAKQAVFLGVMIALVTFLYTFLFVQYRYIASHSYAGLVALMTFAIALEPFYVDQGPSAWNKALLRVVNVMIGCIVGGIVSLVVFPKSTKRLVRDKLESQINLAGEASQAVMMWSAKVFSGQGAPVFLGSVLTEYRNSGDVREGEDDEDDIAAYKAYNKGIKQWKDTKGLFPLMQYDAGLHCAKKLGIKKYEAEFNKQAAIVLARAFRLQTTAVLLHSIARNDQGHDFSEDELNTFSFIGHLIGTLLQCPFSVDSEQIANDLLDQLVYVREFALDEAVDVAESARAISNGDASSMTLMRDALRLRLANGEGNMPLSLYSSDNSSLLFLQLVEHLCLRALRLYYASKKLLGGE